MKAAHLGRVLRTVAHLRPTQIVSQLRYLFNEERRAGTPLEQTPERSIERAFVPFLDAPAHAQYDGALGFELLRRKHCFRDYVDWDFEGYGPLWLFHLHQFDWARGKSVSASARAAFVEDWIEECTHGAGWSPHPISLRILSWGKLRLTPGALLQSPEESVRMDNSLAQQAQTLSERLETRLQANHLFSNVLSCVFAGLLYKGARADAWLALESTLRDQIELQVLADGAHIERSPMYHALLLENVLDLLNVARAADARAPRILVECLESTAAKMLGAHRVWTHPDGEIALFGDSAFDIAHPPEVLEAYADALGVSVREPVVPKALDNAGVFRMESGDLSLIATASSPMPSYQPGHAHCDALSFELSVGTQRVVTDTGVSEYIPGPIRDISRATTSHATVELNHADQSEVWSAHRVGGRAKVVVHEFNGDMLHASCTSWASRDACHHRTFRIDDGALTIEDRIEGDALPARFALPLAPGLDAKLEHRRTNASKTREPGMQEQAYQLSVRLGRKASLTIDLPAGVDWSIERTAYFPHFGSHVDRACLVGKSDGFRSGIWAFNVERA
jgi:hypothetical protein